MSQGSWQTDQISGACKQQPTPGRNTACVNNCGFFGNETTMNMCANCYRNYLSNHGGTDKADTDPVQVDAEGATTMETGGLETASSNGDSATHSSQHPLPNEQESDLNLLDRASTVESNTLGSRARFPRVQSASDRETGVGSFQGGSSDSSISGAAEDLCMVSDSSESKQDFPADALVRTNASRTLDVDLRPKVGALPPLAAMPSPAPRPISGSGILLRTSTSGAVKPNRCLTCRKKVGLTGFKCRCEGLFCGTHRYSDKHDCTFDYKTAGRQAIAKANPVVVADKIIRF